MAGSKVGVAWYELNASDAKLKTALNNADRQITSTGANAEKTFAGRMSKAAGAFGAAVKTAAVVGVAALGAGLALAVTRAAAFEKAMLNVNSIAKLSADDFEAMKDQVIGLSLELPQSAEVLAEGLYQIQSSGFAGAEGIDVLEAAAKAASAGLTTTEVAATGLTGILNAYGLKAADAGRISDVMFKTVDRGVISFEELSGQIGTVTSIAAPLGVGVEEVGAALAVMTRSGVDAARSATGVRAVLSSLLNPSVQAKAVAKELGIEWNADALEANGLAGMMSILMTATGGNEEQMAKLLGTQEGIGAAMILGRDGAAEFTAEIDLMRDSVGATDTALSYQKQGMAYNLELLKNNLDAAAISVGSALLPAIVPLITELGKWLANNQELIGQIAAMVASGFASFVGVVGDFAAAAVGVGRAVVGWVEQNRELIGQILTLSSSVIVSGIQGLVDALLWIGSNDVTLALAIATGAVLGVVGALTLLQLHPVIGVLSGLVIAIGLFKAAWEANWQGIRDVITENGPAIYGTLNSIYAGIQIFSQGVQIVLLAIGQAFRTLFIGVVTAAGVFIRAFAVALAPLDPTMSDILHATADSMGQFTDDMAIERDRVTAEMTAIANAPLQQLPKFDMGVKGFTTALARGGTEAGAVAARNRTILLNTMDLGTSPAIHGANASIRYAGGIGSHYYDVLGKARSISIAASSPLQGVGISAYEWGSRVGSNFAAGLASRYGDVAYRARELAQGAAVNLRIASPAKEGPLNEDASIWGSRLGANFAGGMQSSVGLIQAAADRMADAAAQILQRLEMLIGATTGMAVGSMGAAMGSIGSSLDRPLITAASRAAAQAAYEAKDTTVQTDASRRAALAAYQATRTPFVGSPRIEPIITAEARQAANLAYQRSQTNNIEINVSGFTGTQADADAISRRLADSIRLRAASVY